MRGEEEKKKRGADDGFISGGEKKGKEQSAAPFDGTKRKEKWKIRPWRKSQEIVKEKKGKKVETNVLVPKGVREKNYESLRPEKKGRTAHHPGRKKSERGERGRSGHAAGKGVGKIVHPLRPESRDKGRKKKRGITYFLISR